MKINGCFTGSIKSQLSSATHGLWQVPRFLCGLRVSEFGRFALLGSLCYYLHRRIGLFDERIKAIFGFDRMNNCPLADPKSSFYGLARIVSKTCARPPNMGLVGPVPTLP